MEYHQELLDEIVALKEQVARWRQDANRWEARYNELLEELALVVQSSVSETIDYYGEFEEEYKRSALHTPIEELDEELVYKGEPSPSSPRHRERHSCGVCDYYKRMG